MELYQMRGEDALFSLPSRKVALLARGQKLGLESEPFTGILWHNDSTIVTMKGVT